MGSDTAASQRDVVSSQKGQVVPRGLGVSSVTENRWRPGRPALVSALVSGASILPIALATGRPGFQDYGQWVYQAVVAFSLLQGEPSTVAQFVSYPVPYVTAQLLLLLAVSMWAPITASWVVVGSYLAVGAFVIDRFVWTHRLPRVWGAILATLVIVTPSGFWNGYLGAQIGALLFAFFTTLRRERAVSMPTLMAFALVMFFTHAISFACWVVYAAWIAVSRRRVRILLMSLTPVGVLALWYLLASPHSGASAVWSSGIQRLVTYKAYTAAKFGSYQNLQYGSSGDLQAAPVIYWAGVVANVAAAGLLVGAILWILYRIARDRTVVGIPEIRTILSLVLVAILLPEVWLAVVNPGERVLALALILLLTQVAGASSIVRVRSGALAFAVLVYVLGAAATIASGALLGQKIDARTALPSAQGSDAERGSSLFAHRVNQEFKRLDSADRYVREGLPMTISLAWPTSFLIDKK